MSGCANRRSLIGTLAWAFAVESACGCAGASSDDASTWRPAEAGADGFGSCLSPLAFTARAARSGSVASCLGTGYCFETEPRCA